MKKRREGIANGLTDISRNIPGYSGNPAGNRMADLSNETLLSAVDAAAGATGTEWGMAEAA